MPYLLIPDAIPTPWTRELSEEDFRKDPTLISKGFTRDDLDTRGFNDPLWFINEALEDAFDPYRPTPAALPSYTEPLDYFEDVESALRAAKALNERHPQEFLSCVLFIDLADYARREYQVRAVGEKQKFFWMQRRPFPKAEDIYVCENFSADRAGLGEVSQRPMPGCVILEDQCFALRQNWKAAAEAKAERLELEAARRALEAASLRSATSSPHGSGLSPASLRASPRATIFSEGASLPRLAPRGFALSFGASCVFDEKSGALRQAREAARKAARLPQRVAVQKRFDGKAFPPRDLHFG